MPAEGVEVDDAQAHDHDGEHHDHAHADGISSVSLTSTAKMNPDKVSAWLTDLLAQRGQDILRAKGIMNVAGEDRILVFQSVRMMLEGDYQREWRAGENRCSRLVFIGRNLDSEFLRRGFDACA